MNSSTMRRLVTAFLFIVMLCMTASASQGISPTPSYRQYDPALVDEMYQKGLIENLSQEEYERDLALMNDSINQTLGCDDYPRCDAQGAPVSPVLPVLGFALISLIMGGMIHRKRPDNREE